VAPSLFQVSNQVDVDPNETLIVTVDAMIAAHFWSTSRRTSIMAKHIVT
jgi:hypothetical protein